MNNTNESEFENTNYVELWKKSLLSPKTVSGEVEGQSRNGDFAFINIGDECPILLLQGSTVFLHMKNVACNCRHINPKNVIANGKTVFIPEYFHNGKGYQAQHIYCDKCWTYNKNKLSRQEKKDHVLSNILRELTPQARKDRMNRFLAATITYGESILKQPIMKNTMPGLRKTETKNVLARKSA